MYETCKNTHKLICNTFEAQKSVVSNDLTTYFVLKWKLFNAVNALLRRGYLHLLEEYWHETVDVVLEVGIHCSFCCFM